MIDGPPPEQTTKCRLPSSSRPQPAGQPRQLARDVVIMRLGLQPLGDRALLVVGRAGDQRVGHVRRRESAPSRRRRRSSRSSLRSSSSSGFSSSSWKRTGRKILAQQEVGVLERELVGRALGLRARRHMLGGLRVDLGGRENALGRDWVGHAPAGLAEPAPTTSHVSRLRLAAARSSRSGGSRTSPRPAPRRAAASRSAARRPRG